MNTQLSFSVICFLFISLPHFTEAEKLKPMVDFRDKLGDPSKALTPEIFKPEGTLWLDHTSGYLVPKYLYYDQHPEYFALRLNGQRIPKTTRDSYIHLCLSHPEVVRIATERLLGWIRLQPDKTYFCVTQGDGLDWCQCENCRKMDIQPGNYSDRLLQFVNKLARVVQAEFPDKILLTAAYCGTDVAPVKEKNVWVMYAPYWGLALSEVHPLTHPVNAEALAQFNAWLKVAPENMAIYDYNLNYCPSWDAMAEKIKYYADKGIRGVWFCGEPMNFRDLFHHVVREKMMKDPNQDPEKLKQDFVRSNYGPAAPYVLEYLPLVKERLEKGYPRGIHNRHMPLNFYTDDQVGERCRLLFEKMIAACAGQPALEKKFVAEKELFLKDWAAAETSERARLEYQPTEPEKVPGGLRFPATAFSGGKGPEKQSWY
ncbi:MAG: DUF4838 domain-containing protein, partial [Candidatus Omnitrophica bacterium]|nr:DUF4838 domain-containing protein [Candidatus Omnitrophota bacterium]